MEIDEAYVDSQAPNAGAIKNARGVVLKRKLVGLFRSPDGTLLFGDCKGSGAENYRPSADFADPGSGVLDMAMVETGAYCLVKCHETDLAWKSGPG